MFLSCHRLMNAHYAVVQDGLRAALNVMVQEKRGNL